MPAAHARLATVRTAERRGPDRPSEDRIFTAPNAVIVLDGASQPDASERSGGWLAEQIGAELRDRLTRSGGDLAEMLADSIRTVATRFELTEGESPSTTVAVVRWDTEQVEVLTLGDSPAVVLTRAGTADPVRDDRLRHVAAEQRRAHADMPDGAARHDAWRTLVNAERAVRNSPDGYWIAEAVPTAAHHAVRRSWPRTEVAAILVMTDGVSHGVDRYGIPADWHAAASTALADPRELIDLVHRAEESDPACRRWPRSKPHDDKALAVITFE